MRNESIEQIAYSKYQLDWMLRNNYSLSDLMEELYKHQYDEYAERTSSPVTDIFREWAFNVGFSGSLWVCYEEFLEHEYKDEEYMKRLLTDKEYCLYMETHK